MHQQNSKPVGELDEAVALLVRIGFGGIDIRKGFHLAARGFRPSSRRRRRSDVSCADTGMQHKSWGTETEQRQSFTYFVGDVVLTEGGEASEENFRRMSMICARGYTEHR